MRLKSFILVLLVLLLAAGFIAGCANEGEEEVKADEEIAGDYPGEEDLVTLDCDLTGEQEFKVEELMDFEAKTKEMVRRDDDGEIYDRYPIKGVLFSDVLASLDREKDERESFRITAGDGYSVEVPRDIFIDNYVILAYEIDDKPLYGDTRPIRVFIPGEEAMYWVRNTVEIVLTTGEHAEQDENGEAVFGEGDLEKIYFFEALAQDYEEIDYDEGNGAKAVRAADLLEGLSSPDSVYMMATDGFDKNEEYATVMEAYFLTEGENTPAFRSPDLPRGMHVRDLAWISTGKEGVLSVARADEIFDRKQVNEDEGIGFMDLAEELGLKRADEYILKAADGFSAEVDSDDLKTGIVYIRDSGEVVSEFEDLPGRTAIRNLLLIKPVE